MSDLEDLDHEPDDVSLEEEHTEEDLAAHAGEEHAAGEPVSPMKSIGGGGTVLKIAAGLVVLLGGGVYFVMFSHHAPAQKHIAEAPAPSFSSISRHSPAEDKMLAQKTEAEPPKPVKIASADPLAWTGSAAPVPPAPALAAAPATSSSVNAIIPAPAAIPALPAALPVGQQQPAGSSAAPTPSTSITPPIVNEMPPPAGQLTNAGGTAPAPSLSSAPPSPFGIPEANAPAAPAPLMPEPIQTPAPAQKQVVPAQQQAASAQRQVVKGWPQLPKNAEPMPAAVVAPVDKAEIKTNKVEVNKAAMAPVAPVAQKPTVEQLEKKVADLEKTISQLQQAAVVKDETADKSAEDVEETATAPKPQSSRAAAEKKSHHHTTSSHHKHATARHTTATTKWILKAAKPGVAWVAKKGSDDLRQVQPGDTLPGLGRIKSVIRTSRGTWVVTGTKGRISQ